VSFKTLKITREVKKTCAQKKKKSIIIYIIYIDVDTLINNKY